MGNTYSKGFGLVEILIVIAIITIITAVSINVLSNTKDVKIIQADTALIESVLEETRAKSINSKSESGHGVYFASSTVTTFIGLTYDVNDSNNVEYELNSNVHISDISLNGGGSTVAFSRLRGETSNAGTVTISLKRDATASSTITINSTGTITR